MSRALHMIFLTYPWVLINIRGQCTSEILLVLILVLDHSKHFTSPTLIWSIYKSRQLLEIDWNLEKYIFMAIDISMRRVMYVPGVNQMCDIYCMAESKRTVIDYLVAFILWFKSNNNCLSINLFHCETFSCGSTCNALFCKNINSTTFLAASENFDKKKW